MVKIKVIFLDVDGVLNYEKCPYKVQGIYFVDDEKIRLLKRIIDATDAKVVLSSTWRNGRFLKDESPRECKLFYKLKYKLEEFDIHFLSYTPVNHYSTRAYRGDEIKQWLDNWKGDIVESFIILDDDSDMNPYMDRLIQTSWYKGLTERDVEKSIKMLNECSEMA